MYIFFFFFQAEDGIRDLTVTGVQTCALPILNVVDHLRLRQHTRRGIAHGAVERTAVIEGRTRDAASFTLLREAVDIERRGAKVVDIRDHRNIEVRGDDAVIV